MLKKLLMGFSVVLFAAGLLVAADNSWRFPVPSLGGLVTGDLIYAQNANNLGNINAVATGQVLTSAGVSTIPAWSASPTLTGGTFSGLTASKPVFTSAAKALTSTGTMPVDQGGTNLTSYAVGDLLYASGATTLAKLADVAAGQILTSGGVGVAPAYSATIPTGTASPEKTDGSVFLPAVVYCRSDTPSAAMVETRIAANDWALARTATGAETYNVICSLDSWLQRTTASKGIKINSIDVVYQITVANLTSHTWGKVATVTYANGAANTVGAELATAPTLTTVSTANPYVDAVSIAAPAYFPTASKLGLTVEWAAVLANTGVYRVYGINVNFSRTDL